VQPKVSGGRALLLARLALAVIFCLNAAAFVPLISAQAYYGGDAGVKTRAAITLVGALVAAFSFRQLEKKPKACPISPKDAPPGVTS
jgi:hypothetical protein